MDFLPKTFCLHLVILQQLNNSRDFAASDENLALNAVSPSHRNVTEIAELEERLGNESSDYKQSHTQM
jgi:hypothetical protein